MPCNNAVAASTPAETLPRKSRRDWYIDWGVISLLGIRGGLRLAIEIAPVIAVTLPAD